MADFNEKDQENFEKAMNDQRKYQQEWLGRFLMIFAGSLVLGVLLVVFFAFRKMGGQ